MHWYHLHQAYLGVPFGQGGWCSSESRQFGNKADSRQAWDIQVEACAGQVTLGAKPGEEWCSQTETDSYLVESSRFGHERLEQKGGTTYFSTFLALWTRRLNELEKQSIMSMISRRNPNKPSRGSSWPYLERWIWARLWVPSWQSRQFELRCYRWLGPWVRQWLWMIQMSPMLSPMAMEFSTSLWVFRLWDGSVFLEWCSHWWWLCFSWLWMMVMNQDLKNLLRLEDGDTYFQAWMRPVILNTGCSSITMKGWAILQTRSRKSMKLVLKSILLCSMGCFMCIFSCKGISRGFDIWCRQIIRCKAVGMQFWRGCWGFWRVMRPMASLLGKWTCIWHFFAGPSTIWNCFERGGSTIAIQDVGQGQIYQSFADNLQLEPEGEEPTEEEIQEQGIRLWREEIPEPETDGSPESMAKWMIKRLTRRIVLGCVEGRPAMCRQMAMLETMRGVLRACSRSAYNRSRAMVMMHEVTDLSVHESSGPEAPDPFEYMVDGIPEGLPMTMMPVELMVPATIPPYIAINDHWYFTAGFDDLPEDSVLEHLGADWDLYHQEQSGYRYRVRQWETNEEFRRHPNGWFNVICTTAWWITWVTMGSMQVFLHHCMVDNLDHHEWHLQYDFSIA